MNIVKFQDTVLNESNNKNMLSEEKVNLFNNKLKGKYAYAINFKFVVPFEDITFEQYYEISKNESAIDGITYIELIDISDFIDQSKTQIANSITVFEESNKFTTDSDITLGELKEFRTWLADKLYTLFNDSLDSITKEMLNYYREEMHDDTIDHLSYFASGTEHDLISTTNTSSCGCQNNTQIFNQYAISSCNPIYMYRKGVYEKMVSVFSDIDFWLKLNKDFLKEIKRYIDGIIKCNLPLHTSQFSTTLHDCGCLTRNNVQEERMQILIDLSSCFYFLETQNYVNKKNHISLTLNKWASLLYERMRWY
jgi:hypothetical protein